MNLSEWLASKKTKDILMTQAALAVVAIFVVYYAKGEPERIKAIMESLTTILSLIAGTGATGVVMRGIVDANIAKAAPLKPQEPAILAAMKDGLPEIQKALSEIRELSKGIDVPVRMEVVGAKVAPAAPAPLGPEGALPEAAPPAP